VSSCVGICELEFARAQYEHSEAVKLDWRADGFTVRRYVPLSSHLDNHLLQDK